VTANDVWSESLKSSHIKDETLAIESQVLKDALAEWSRHGSIPARSQLTARASKAFLGHLMIFERQGATFRIRLMGTRIAAVLGEMQGQTVDEALPAEVAARWNAAINDVLDGGKPQRIAKTVAFKDLHFLNAEIFLAPLLDGEGKPNMVFAVAAFRSGVA